MNERAIMLLMRMLNSYEETPYFNWPQYIAEKSSFSRCAIEESLRLIWDHPKIPASETIKNFAEKMEIYRDSAVMDDQRRIFSIMSETALRVLQEIEPFDRFVS